MHLLVYQGLFKSVTLPKNQADFFLTFSDLFPNVVLHLRKLTSTANRFGT